MPDGSSSAAPVMRPGPKIPSARPSWPCSRCAASRAGSDRGGGGGWASELPSCESGSAIVITPSYLRRDRSHRRSDAASGSGDVVDAVVGDAVRVGAAGLHGVGVVGRGRLIAGLGESFL